MRAGKWGGHHPFPRISSYHDGVPKVVRLKGKVAHQFGVGLGRPSGRPVCCCLWQGLCAACRFQEAFSSKLNARSGHQALQAHLVSSLHQAKRVGRWGHHTPGKEGDPAEGVPRAPWPRARVSCTPLVPSRPLVSSRFLSKPHPQRPSEEATLPCGPQGQPQGQSRALSGGPGPWLSSISKPPPGPLTQAD